MISYVCLRFSECLNPVFYNLASRLVAAYEVISHKYVIVLQPPAAKWQLETKMY